MEFYLEPKTGVPIQAHRESRERFDALSNAAIELVKPSNSIGIFKEILTSVEGLSNREKITQLENAFSKYDALHMELTKRCILFKDGLPVKDEQERAHLQNNVKEIISSIKAELELLYSQDSMNSSFDLRNQPIITHQSIPRKIVLDGTSEQNTRQRKGSEGYGGNWADLTPTNNQSRYGTTASRNETGKKSTESMRHQDRTSDYPYRRSDALIVLDSDSDSEI